MTAPTLSRADWQERRHQPCRTPGCPRKGSARAGYCRPCWAEQTDRRRLQARPSQGTAAIRFPDLPEDRHCAGMPVDRFYDQPELAQRHLVATVCAGCPAREPCVAWALANSEHGVWGSTEGQRAAWRRRRT